MVADTWRAGDVANARHPVLPTLFGARAGLRPCRLRVQPERAEGYWQRRLESAKAAAADRASRARSAPPVRTRRTQAAATTAPRNPNGAR